MAFKLNKSIAMLSKLRHVFDVKALRSVNYATFESYLCYTCLGTKQVKRLHLLQKKISQDNALSKQKFA